MNDAQATLKLMLSARAGNACQDIWMNVKDTAPPIGHNMSNKMARAAKDRWILLSSKVAERDHLNVRSI